MKGDSLRLLQGTKSAAVSATVLATVWLCAATLDEPPRPSLPKEDRVCVAEAFRLAEKIGDAIWPGWARVPFALVLVTPDTEFFIRHPAPPADAQSLGEDTLLGSAVFARPRTFPTNFQATFPVEGVSTVVVGQPAGTRSSSSTDWVVTVLHEHFHQLQESQPGFEGRVAALGLARGDTTGMWMLNFPFPYDARPVVDAYRAAALALRDPFAADHGPRISRRAPHSARASRRTTSLTSTSSYGKKASHATRSFVWPSGRRPTTRRRRPSGPFPDT
jgi:hypothetical protein